MGEQHVRMPSEARRFGEPADYVDFAVRSSMTGLWRSNRLTYRESAGAARDYIISTWDAADCIFPNLSPTIKRGLEDGECGSWIRVGKAN